MMGYFPGVLNSNRSLTKAYTITLLYARRRRWTHIVAHSWFLSDAVDVSSLQSSRRSLVQIVSYTVSVHNQPSLFFGFSIELSLLPSYKVATGTHGGLLHKI
jgi:hypothetical protein